MRTILVIIALTMTLNVAAQKKFDITKDEKNGSVVYVGQISFQDLSGEKSFTWLNQATYKPDAESVNFLKQNLPKYRLITFMGTWCDDSHILIPQLQKVLTEAQFPLEELTMYAVDRTKTTPDGAHAQYDIKFVLAVIVLQGGKEVGRITESARKSVEADLVNIIRSAR